MRIFWAFKSRNPNRENPLNSSIDIDIDRIGGSYFPSITIHKSRRVVYV